MFQLQFCAFTNCATHENLTSRNGLHLSGFRVELFGRSTHDTNVSNLDLSTTIGASCPMNTDRSINIHQPFKLFGYTFCVTFCLNKGQSTKFRTSTTNKVSFNETRVYFESSIIQGRLRQKTFDISILDIRKNDILLHCETNLSSRVVVCQVSNLATFFCRQASRRNQDPYTRQSFLRLFVNTHRFSSLKGRVIMWLSILNSDPTVVTIYFLNNGLFEVFHPILFHQPHESRLLAIFTFSFITENPNDGFAKCNDTGPISRNPHVPWDTCSNPFDTHVATKHDVETHLSRCGMLAWVKPNIINICMGKIITRS
mmetsp:Transcript_1810/g.2725  ORF Transcript_1810/g.2725 Transcript_1810/m.2725 type:complete len:313 (+) Transcript_1810:360-1298(+)